MKRRFTHLTNPGDSKGLFTFGAAERAVRLSALFIFFIVIQIHGAAPQTQRNCPSRWIDSLVYAGKRSLDSGNIQNAGRYFTIAYRCGMSKDSMLYFAAETYLRSFSLDTALTFNWGLEKSGHLPQKMFLEQRSRIFRMMGWNRQADSILTLIRKKVRYDLGMVVSASRNILQLNNFTIPPKGDLLFQPGEIIDDAGNAEIRNRVSRYHDTWFKQTFMMLNINGDFKIPTRYSFTDENDTLTKSISCYIGAGELPLTPGCILGHRLAIHPDKKIDHFDKVNISFPFKEKEYLSIGHDIKWTNKSICDDRTDLLFSRFSFQRKITWIRTICASHHYTEFNQYENESGSSGIYPIIPLGYTDSLVLSDSSQPRFHYYRDRNLTKPFDIDNPFLNEFWDQQPGMRLVTQPENDIDATFKSTLQFSLPFEIALNVNSYAQCEWYPKKARWFTVDDSVPINYFEMFKNYAVLFNSTDGKYYINKDRTQPGYMKGNLVELKKHEKTRIDYYFFIGVNIEKGLGKIGKVYFSTSYLKGFSTLPDNIPLITLNHNWEIQAGWKKEISFVK